MTRRRPLLCCPPGELRVHAFRGHGHVTLYRILADERVGGIRLAIVQSADSVGQMVILSPGNEEHVCSRFCRNVLEPNDGFLPGLDRIELCWEVLDAFSIHQRITAAK